MPGSRTTLPHTYLTLLLTAPLSCHPDDQPGQVSDPHGCRTIILPNDPTTTSSSSTTNPDTSSSTATTDISTSTSTDPTDATTTQTSSSTTGPTPTCGDGNIDDGEECDNGPDMNGPGMSCLANCTANTCGDGDQGPDEECDNGPDNADDAACTSTCTLAKCGDSLIQKDIEECDDGNTDPGDGCSADCTIEVYRVFLSSTNHFGALGGLAGADARCQELADGANLPGSYRAWLSTTAYNPSNRFGIPPGFSGRFALLNGTLIAEDWDDLRDGDISAPININQIGVLVADDQYVWTNVSSQGSTMSNSDHCSSWSTNSGSQYGRVGRSSYKSLSWTSANSLPCGSSARLYCFQVP